MSHANGTYTVQVAMQPANLGHVRAALTLDGNNLQVSITPQTSAGHDALSSAVDALKDELARGGLNVNVTLRDPSSQSGGDAQRQAGTERNAPLATENVAKVSLLSSASASASGQVHLIL
jgi:flagellar hook-length control protein FliK